LVLLRRYALGIVSKVHFWEVFRGVFLRNSQNEEIFTKILCTARTFEHS
jgi:hypothetical protein